MRRIILCLSLLVLGAAAARADVLGEARAGKLQCYEPDVQRKTCRGLFRTVVKPDGTATSGGDVLLNVVNGNSVLIMRSPQSSVTIKGNMTCGPIRRSDIEDAEFLLDGKPVNAASDRRMKDDMEARQAARGGQTECSVFTPAGDTWVVTDTLDGKPQPNSAHMIWVGPADGYKVAP